MPDFVSFNEFIDRTDAAKPEQFLPTLGFSAKPGGPAPAAVAPMAALAATSVARDTFEAEFARMKKFLLDRYAGVRCEHTFIDSSGNHVDCIPFEQQQTLRTARKAGHQPPAKAPDPSPLQEPPLAASMNHPPIPTPFVPPLRRGLTDPYGNRVGCPEGSVSLHRVTLSQMVALGTFERFFEKQPGRGFPPDTRGARKGAKGAKGAKGKAKPPARTAAKKKTTSRKPVPPQAGVGQEIHGHIVWQDTRGGPYYGCSHGLSIWARDPSPGIFNLSQLWMLGRIQGGVQSIESGWINYPGLRGLGQDPGLFVFYNPNNYDPSTSGYLVNQSGEGFILWPGSGWTLFSGLHNHSTPGGDPVGLQMLWQLKDDGNWWLYVGQDADNFEKVGYFPAALYSPGPLGQAADVIQFGGEVAGAGRTGPMGSGVAPYPTPEDSWREVAFQYEIYVQKAQGADMVQASLQQLDTSNEPGYSPNYQGALYDDPKWDSFVFFGGPTP
jgi:hypothetical protein